MPHPPQEFVAIQVGRLNEAMLVAFSAMSPANLKAVDQVVKIVRELDRYGGAFAAEWARPKAPPLEAPSDEDAAFASAWLYGPVAALAERGDAVADRVYKAAASGARPGNSAQGFENVESAPGIATGPVAALHSPSRHGRPHGRPTERGDAVNDRVYKTGGAGERPENPAQGLEKVESAPGIATGPVAALHSPSRDGRPHGRPTERGDAVNDRVDKAAASGAIARKIRRKALKRLNPRPG